MEWTVETCVFALVVAIALLWLVFSAARSEKPTSQIVAADLQGDDADVAHTLDYHAVGDGVVAVTHRGLSLATGDTVNVIITITGTLMTIAEKRGLMAPAGAVSVPSRASWTVNFVTCHPHTVRFESDITGEWSVTTFTPTEGAHVTTALKL